MKRKKAEEKTRANIYIASDVATILATVKPKSKSEFFNDTARLAYRWQDQILEQVNASIDAKLADFREEIRALLIECHRQQNEQISEIKNVLINNGKSES